MKKTEAPGHHTEGSSTEIKPATTTDSNAKRSAFGVGSQLGRFRDLVTRIARLDRSGHLPDAPECHHGGPIQFCGNATCHKVARYINLGWPWAYDTGPRDGIHLVCRKCGETVAIDRAVADD